MADSVTRISAILESARELTIEAASSASLRLSAVADLGSSSLMQLAEVRKLLSSSSERDKLSGMKQVVARICNGKDDEAIEFFPEVVKNVTSSNIETRRLVYSYLIRYAEYEPDTALLSINTIQKSLADQSPVVRALAIRAMSGIRVPAIAQIVVLAIKQGCSDPSPFVRRAAAVSIPKCADLDPSTVPILGELLPKLLNDNDHQVLGFALTTLDRTFPDRLDLIHPVFRKICRSLIHFDDFCQISALNILLRYSRMYLPCRGLSRDDNLQFDDYDLMLDSLRNLVYSRNSAVIIAYVRLIFYLTTHEAFIAYCNSTGLNEATVRLLRVDSSIQQIVLRAILPVILERKDAFAPFVKRFYVFPTDSTPTQKYKIYLLDAFCTAENCDAITSELMYYAMSSEEPEVISAAVRSLNNCAGVSPRHKNLIFKWLLYQISSSSTALVVECLNVIRAIVLSDESPDLETVCRLVSLLNTSIVDEAYASVIWLVGEFVGGVAAPIAPDVLRMCLKGFADRGDSVRYQIVLLAAKIYLYYLVSLKEGKCEESPGLVQQYEYAMDLAEVDPSYDTRDRARMFRELLSGSPNIDIATLMLQAPKPIPDTSMPDIASPSKFLIGSCSSLLNHNLNGYQTIPEFSEVLPAPSIRDEDVTTPNRSVDVVRSISSSQVQNHGVPAIVSRKPLTNQSLDEFLADVEPADSASSSEDDDEDEDEDEDDFSEEDEESEGEEDESEEGSDSDLEEGDESEENEDDGPDDNLKENLERVSLIDH